MLVIILDLTNSNQRLGSAFDDLDPRLVMTSSAPAKSAGVPDTRPKIHSFIHSLNQRCPIQCRLQSVLGVN